MIGGLFKPKNNIKLHQYFIGNQYLIIIELLDNKNKIIINKLVEDLLIKYDNIYFFDTFSDMEYQLDDLITSTFDNYIVVIG